MQVLSLTERMLALSMIFANIKKQQSKGVQDEEAKYS